MNNEYHSASILEMAADAEAFTVNRNRKEPDRMNSDQLDCAIALSRVLSEKMELSPSRRAAFAHNHAILALEKALQTYGHDIYACECCDKKRRNI